MEYPGILGFGEVGQVIHQLYSDAGQLDNIKDNNGVWYADWIQPNRIQCLHVCIPFNDITSFYSVIKGEVELLPNLEIVIIHSTVGVGTTRFISEQLQRLQLQLPVVHIPIRGDHLTLAKNIKDFTLFIGSLANPDGYKAMAIMQQLGVTTVEIMKPPETTELGKLLDTTYYGLCIAFHAEAEQACNSFQINFFDAVTRFNTTYNKGYSNMGKTGVVRPTLYPPPDHKIGGHCIIPNAELLKKHGVLQDVVNLILKYNKDQQNA